MYVREGTYRLRSPGGSRAQCYLWRGVRRGSLPGGQRVAVEAATPREGGKLAAQSSRCRPLRSVTLGSPYPTTPDPSVTEHSDRHHSHCLAITETPIPAPS